MRLKKGVKRVLILLCCLLIGGIGVATYFFVVKKDEVKEVKVLKEIKGYGYTLKDNKSAAYKKLFSKLDEVLSKKNIDEEEYVELISKMFILDFYSLDEKAAKTDVGGTDFVYQEILTDFLENAEDTIYKYVESDIYKQRKQELPTVKDVQIKSMEQEAFNYLEETDDKAYVVEVNWTYKDENKAKGYQDNATLVFVHNGKRLDLVELK